MSCGFCGPTSPLAFGEAVLGAVSGSVEDVKNKEQLWRMWSVVVNPLTDTITQVINLNHLCYIMKVHFSASQTLYFTVIEIQVIFQTQTNEVNQGDALEHNFSAIYSALMFPVFHLLPRSALPQVRANHSFRTTLSPVYVYKYLICLFNFNNLFDFNFLNRPLRRP